LTISYVKVVAVAHVVT